MPTYQRLRSLLDYNGKIAPYIYGNNIHKRISIITKEHEDKYNKLYNNNKDNKIENNTTLCMSPLSNLPNYKLKSYITENKLNIKTVRRTSKPNILVINDSLIKEYYFNSHYYNTGLFYIVPVEFLKTIQTKNHNEKLIADFYYINDNILDVFKTKYPNYYNELIQFEKITGKIIDIEWGNKKAYECFDLFISLLDENLPYKIVFDHSINNDINKDLVIDDDMFINLINMLKSSDKDNHNLAREIVANCELELSKPYILFLLWKYEEFKKTNNNKNFKFCLDALKPYKEIYYNRMLDNFLAKIINKHPEYSQTIFNCLRLYINNENNKDIIKGITIS